MEEVGKLRDDNIVPSSLRETLFPDASALRDGYRVVPGFYYSTDNYQDTSFGQATQAGAGPDGYETVVGLEVHVELCTSSKLFCGCENRFGAPPNTLCCPVCAGLADAPAPALNRRAVDFALRLGLALGCRINLVSGLARKHYDYPDLPKGYQITQHETPLCEGGELPYLLDGEVCRVGIERIHIEEDAGRLKRSGADALVDLNRAGVPLVEVVTRPALAGPDQAAAALEGLAVLLRHLGISDVRMHQGSLRADVNVSLRRPGGAPGERTELKNLNSFGAVRRAVAFEAARQAALLAGGGAVRRQTLHWDDPARKARPARDKEAGADYHYMAAPDLPSIHLTGGATAAAQAALPELPVERYRRFRRDYGLPAQKAALLCEHPGQADFFEQTLAAAPLPLPPKPAAGWLLGEVAALLNARGAELEATALSPERFGQLLALVERGDVSGSAAKKLLPQLMDSDADPWGLAEAQGLLQLSDEAALRDMAQTVLAENPGPVGDYRRGKSGVLGYLVGRCMARSGGRANPAVLSRLLEKLLDGENGQKPSPAVDVAAE